MLSVSWRLEDPAPTSRLEMPAKSYDPASPGVTREAEKDGDLLAQVPQFLSLPSPATDTPTQAGFTKSEAPAMAPSW